MQLSDRCIPAATVLSIKFYNLRHAHHPGLLSRPLSQPARLDIPLSGSVCFFLLKLGSMMPRLLVFRHGDSS